MTGIYKKFKSGTDIRGIGIGNGDCGFSQRKDRQSDG